MKFIYSDAPAAKTQRTLLMKLLVFIGWWAIFARVDRRIVLPRVAPSDYVLFRLSANPIICLPPFDEAGACPGPCGRDDIKL